jgi:hypothetical protein
MRSVVLSSAAAIACAWLGGCVPMGAGEIIYHAARLSQPGGLRVPRPPSKPPSRRGAYQHYNPRTGHYYDRTGRRVNPPRPALPGFHYNPRTGHYYDSKGNRVDYRGRPLRFIPGLPSGSRYRRVPIQTRTHPARPRGW